MGTVAIILKRSPYGDINAAEAVRHALGAVSFELGVDLILVDGGVLLAKKGQDDAGTGFTNLEGVLRDCLEMGVPVHADDDSLRARHLTQQDLIDGVTVVTGMEIAGMVTAAQTTLLF